MKSFKNILVVVDSTRTEHHELERAMKLAEHGGVKLHLVDIVKDASLTVRLLSRDYLHIHELLVKEKREQLQVLVDHCKSHGIEADGEVARPAGKGDSPPGLGGPGKSMGPTRHGFAVDDLAALGDDGETVSLRLIHEGGGKERPRTGKGLTARRGQPGQESGTRGGQKGPPVDLDRHQSPSPKEKPAESPAAGAISSFSRSMT